MLSIWVQMSVFDWLDFLKQKKSLESLERKAKVEEINTEIEDKIT